MIFFKIKLVFLKKIKKKLKLLLKSLEKIPLVVNFLSFFEEMSSFFKF
jgi:hypothetical protein